MCERLRGRASERARASVCVFEGECRFLTIRDLSRPGISAEERRGGWIYAGVCWLRPHTRVQNDWTRDGVVNRETSSRGTSSRPAQLALRLIRGGTLPKSV